MLLWLVVGLAMSLDSSLAIPLNNIKVLNFDSSRYVTINNKYFPQINNTSTEDIKRITCYNRDVWECIAVSPRFFKLVHFQIKCQNKGEIDIDPDNCKIDCQGMSFVFYNEMYGFFLLRVVVIFFCAIFMHNLNIFQ